jgi:hypothetical protein
MVQPCLRQAGSFLLAKIARQILAILASLDFWVPFDQVITI